MAYCWILIAKAKLIYTKYLTLVDYYTSLIAGEPEVIKLPKCQGSAHMLSLEFFYSFILGTPYIMISELGASMT